MKVITFIDLEETIIESWSNPVIVNRDKLLSIFEKLSISIVNIFSFAIWNSSDNAIFNVEMKDKLEEACHITIKDVLLMTDVNVAFRKRTGIYFDDVDFSTIFMKQNAFIEHIKSTTEGNCAYILIDDTVDNLSMHFVDSNTYIYFINILNYQSLPTIQ